MDMLVVPSLWNETFSFVTTEALSYGTPVLVSSTVGAKDIVKKIDPDFIFSDEETLYTKLKECLLHPSILQKYNEKIMQKEFLFDMKSHAEKICEFYQKV
jgi:glycosyltransferase involved in cell wall biosynthesis